MPLTRDEFLHILVLARHVASADGEMHPKEKRVLGNLFKALDVTLDEREELRHHGSLKVVLQHLHSAEAKLALIDVLVLVASADGRFEASERQFIEKIMSVLELYPEQYPYFHADGSIELAQVMQNVKSTIEKLKHPPQEEAQEQPEATEPIEPDGEPLPEL